MFYYALLLAEATKVTGKDIALIVICLAFAGVLAAVLFRRDEGDKMKKQALIKAAGILRSLGMEIIPHLIECYATGDWARLHIIIDREVNKLEDVKHIEQEFDKVFYHLVEVKCQDPGKRMTLVKHVIDAANKNIDGPKLSLVKLPVPNGASNSGGQQAPASALGATV